jgi:uncharacterized membrane protein
MKIRTAMLASAAAALFVAAAATPALAEDKAEATKVKCEGVNECKGHGACKGAKNACSGQNGCKGQGFVMLTAEECEKAKAGKK